MMNKLICTFLSQQESQSTLSCDVAYGLCEQQPTMIARGTISSTNVMDIYLIPDLSQTNDYCYVVNASNGTLSIIVEGMIESSELINAQRYICMADANIKDMPIQWTCILAHL